MDSKRTAQHIIPHLLHEGNMADVPTDPMQWPNTLLVQFGGSIEVKTLLKNARVSIRQQLASHGIGPIMGLYAMYDAQGKCLYVGKSTNFYSRFYIHYKASIGLEKVEKYREFFGQRTETIAFRWIQVQFPEEHRSNATDPEVKMLNYKGETLRIALERLITCHMLATTTDPVQPIFEHLYYSKK